MQQQRGEMRERGLEPDGGKEGGVRREFFKRKREMQLTLDDYKEGSVRKARREQAYEARRRDEEIATALRVTFLAAIDEGAKIDRESWSEIGGSGVGEGGAGVGRGAAGGGWDEVKGGETRKGLLERLRLRVAGRVMEVEEGRQGRKRVASEFTNVESEEESREDKRRQLAAENEGTGAETKKDLGSEEGENRRQGRKRKGADPAREEEEMRPNENKRRRLAADTSEEGGDDGEQHMPEEGKRKVTRKMLVLQLMQKVAKKRKGQGEEERKQEAEEEDEKANA